MIYRNLVNFVFLSFLCLIYSFFLCVKRLNNNFRWFHYRRMRKAFECILSKQDPIPSTISACSVAQWCIWNEMSLHVFKGGQYFLTITACSTVLQFWLNGHAHIEILLHEVMMLTYNITFETFPSVFKRWNWWKKANVIFTGKFCRTKLLFLGFY